MVTSDEARLVEAARAGDVEAFGEIVRLHERRLRLVLVRVLGDDSDAEEAVQDTFVQAWRHLDHYRADAALFTWLYRIGVNEALARKRRKRVATVELVVAESQTFSQVPRDTQPEGSAESSETRSAVEQALARLPDDQREAVVLRDLVGLSNEEVADALELTVPAAKSRIHRGRMQLRVLLEPFNES